MKENKQNRSDLEKGSGMNEKKEPMETKTKWHNEREWQKKEWIKEEKLEKKKILEEENGQAKKERMREQGIQEEQMDERDNTIKKNKKNNLKLKSEWTDKKEWKKSETKWRRTKEGQRGIWSGGGGFLSGLDSSHTAPPSFHLKRHFERV